MYRSCPIGSTVPVTRGRSARPLPALFKVWVCCARPIAWAEPEAARVSASAGEDKFKQLGFDGYEARAAVEVPGEPIVRLDDDLQRWRPLRDRITFGIGEEPMSDPTLLVAGRDEQLLDHYRPVLLVAKRDVARRLTLLPSDEDQIAP